MKFFRKKSAVKQTEPPIFSLPVDVAYALILPRLRIHDLGRFSLVCRAFYQHYKTPDAKFYTVREYFPSVSDEVLNPWLRAVLTDPVQELDLSMLETNVFSLHQYTSLADLNRRGVRAAHLALSPWLDHVYVNIIHRYCENGYGSPPLK